MSRSRIKKPVPAKVKAQKKMIAKRNKFGPSMKAAPLIVKNIDATIEPRVKVMQRKELVDPVEKSPWLDTAARAVGHKDYASYLSSPHWRQLRKKVLERDEHSCQTCRSRAHLHVHHLTYKRLGKELMRDLKTLCNECHKEIHKRA